MQRAHTANVTHCQLLPLLFRPQVQLPRTHVQSRQWCLAPIVDRDRGVSPAGATATHAHARARARARARAHPPAHTLTRPLSGMAIADAGVVASLIACVSAYPCIRRILSTKWGGCPYRRPPGLLVPHVYASITSIEVNPYLIRVIPCLSYTYGEQHVCVIAHVLDCIGNTYVTSHWRPGLLDACVYVCLLAYIDTSTSACLLIHLHR